MWRRIILGLTLTIAFSTVVAAQPAPDRTTRLSTQWAAILADVQREQGFAGAAATNEQKTALYREAVRRLLIDPELGDYFTPSRSDIDALIQARTPENEIEQIAALANAAAGERGAKSLNASSTNPTASRAAERSGFTDLVALALDTRNIVAADKSAVSLNLNALALVGLNSAMLSAPAAYRRYDALRRLGGTFTFGAKVPEGEITGLTGLPSADTLFDVFAWDAKVRVIGDRDPRSRQWDEVMVGTLGGLTEIAATLPALVPITDAKLLVAVLNDTLGLATDAVRERIGKSLQVSVKFAGQHLTNATGKDKYTLAVLGDQGFGNADLTFNFLYTAVDDVTISPGTLFNVKTWSGSIGINVNVARNLLVQGRTTELSFNANVEMPVDDDALPVDRESLWRLVASVALPWGDAAKIPVSISFTNDPNRLTKEKFVSGYVGISYDFGGLKSLFKPQTSPAQ